MYGHPGSFDFLGLLGLLDLLPETQIWLKDREGRFLAASQALLAHFGLERASEIEGRTDFDLYPDHLAREYAADDRRVLDGGIPIRDKMELVRDKDGTLGWYATTKVPLRGPQGTIVGTAGMTRPLRAVDTGNCPGRDMNRVVRHIETEYAKDLRVGNLAEMAGMSVDAFERRFRAAYRETPLKYLNRIRIRAACGLLIHTQIPIAEVSRQCGFADPSYFSKRFYAHLHVRPVEYRRKYSGVTGAALQITRAIRFRPSALGATRPTTSRVKSPSPSATK